MRKKKFAGVLMLTAAVALGTVSPAALPNTVAIVKAEASDVTNPSNKYDNIKLENTTVENETLVLTAGATDIGTIMNDTHYYAFGKDKATALAAAIAAANGETAAAKVVVTANKFTTKTVPADANWIVIVDKTDLSDTVANGRAIDFTTKRKNPAEKNTDYSYTDGEGQATALATKKLQYRVKGENNWIDVTGADGTGTKFPTTPVTEKTKVDYEVRVQAGDSMLPSVPTDLSITHKHKITIDDVKEKLKFSVEGTALKVTGFTSNFGDTDKFSGKVMFKYAEDKGTISDGSAAVSDVNIVADVTTSINKKVFVYVDSDTDKILTISFAKLDQPKLKQIDKEYKLEADAGYTVKTATDKVKYQIKKATEADGTYVDAAVQDEGNKKVITFTHLGGSNVNYKVKAVSTEAKEIKFGTGTEAKYTFDSEASADIAVQEDDTKLDAAKFNSLTLATEDNNKKLTIDVKAAVQNVKDEVFYNYGKGDVKLDLKTVKKHELDVVPGKFVLKSKDEKFKKTINFVVPNLKDKYSKVDEFVKDLGNKADIFNNYIITDKDKHDLDMDGLNKLKEGKYTVKFRTATAVGEVNVEIGKEQEYKLATPVEVTIKKVTSSSPVIPSSDNSAAPKKDEPKKDETKKDEVKKDEPKKDETKQAEDNKQSDSTSTTETKSEERVSAKNTKNNTVKVSEEKIAEALETGLKVMAKSGKVEFTAKAIEKMVGNSAEAVTVTLKTTATKSNAKEVTKNLKGSKLVSKKVFTLNIKAGNMAVKESQLSGTKINVTLKVNLKKAPVFVWVMDLSTGKKVKAAYKNGKLTFKTSNLGKFVIVNK